MTKQLVNKNNPVPRYLQVMQFIEDRIRYGQYSPGAQIPGERDLSVEFQVSQMTVNKAILALVDGGYLLREHGKGTFVRSDLRSVGPTTMNVGVVVNITPDKALEDLYTGTLFRGMQRSVVNAPVSLSILEARGDLAERLETKPMDGYLFVGLLERYVPLVRQLRRSGKRVVVLGADWSETEAPFVDSDNNKGTRCAMEHLIGMGHRRIAGAFALLSSSNSRDRLSAFNDVLREHDIAVPSSFLVVEEQASLVDGGACELSNESRQRLRRLLRLDQRPTAFFCGGYYVALDVIQVAKEEGLTIPDDISIVGFDDPISAAYLTPPLTTIRQPLDEMGQRAMTMLVDWFQKRMEPEGGLVLPTSLIIRGSASRPL